MTTNILFIEPLNLLVQMYGEYLQNHRPELRVQFVKNQQEAIEYLAHRKFDTVRINYPFNMSSHDFSNLMAKAKEHDLSLQIGVEENSRPDCERALREIYAKTENELSNLEIVVTPGIDFFSEKEEHFSFEPESNSFRHPGETR